MSIFPKRAWGYTRGEKRKSHYAAGENFDVTRDEVTNRKTIPTKSVDLKSLGLKLTNLGIPIHSSDAVPMLKPIFVDHGALPYHYGFYLHPTDYYWVKYADNPERAHRRVEGWLAMRIDEMAEAALDRIDNMFRDPQEIHERKIDDIYRRIFKEQRDLPMETQAELIMEWWNRRQYREPLEAVGTAGSIHFGQNFAVDVDTGKVFDGESMVYPWEAVGLESEAALLSLRLQYGAFITTKANRVFTEMMNSA